VLEAALVVVALFLGAGVAWVAAWTHFASRGHAERRARDVRIAELEARADELRRQLGEKSSELDGVRREITAERSQRADSDARLDEARKSLDEQRRVFDEARVNLKETFEALSHQALSGQQRVRSSRKNGSAGASRRSTQPLRLRSALERYEGGSAAWSRRATRRTAVCGRDRAAARSASSSRGDRQSLAVASRSPQVRAVGG
jgi:chromosome segregation ATPase